MMNFHDLHAQYAALKTEIDAGIASVLESGQFILGKQVAELEEKLAADVGRKHCVCCGNGTDALILALKMWGVKAGDAVFVPDFTYFASAGCADAVGATAIPVDIRLDTFNICTEALEAMIEKVKAEGKLTPRVIVVVDLFGQPAEHDKVRAIADKYGLKVLEDAAQGYGGSINGRAACSFGDAAITSFFPAKPLGCYGDGGAVFVDTDEDDALLRSLRANGRSPVDKYDNVRCGLNSRLDTLQAAILLPKLKALRDYELDALDKAADHYTRLLSDIVVTPTVLPGYRSSWAQYTVLLKDRAMRDAAQAALKAQGIPTMVYYPKGMHSQTAFAHCHFPDSDYQGSLAACDRVLSLPMHPYLTGDEIETVAAALRSFVESWSC